MANTDLQTPRSTAFGYSSKVRLDLIVGGRTIPLAKVRHDRIVLTGPTALPVGAAEMVLYVDGEPRRWKIEILPHDPADVRIPIRRLA